jgi:hypothetical protein
MGDRGFVQWELKRLAGEAVEKVRQRRTVLSPRPMIDATCRRSSSTSTPQISTASHPFSATSSRAAALTEDLQEALRPFDDAMLTTAKLALELDLADQIALRVVRASAPFAVRPPAEARCNAEGTGAASSRSSWTWWVQAPLSSRAGGNIRTFSHARVPAAWQMGSSAEDEGVG